MAARSVKSLVEYFGTQEDRHCGYCKNDDPSRFTHGMWAHHLTVQAYQDMLDRGWRRSGKYCYKPTMEKTCCPQYTIRCDTLQFHPSRSQKRVVRRLNTFLANGVMPKRSAYDVDVDHPIKKKKESIDGPIDKNSEMKPISSGSQQTAEATGEKSEKPKNDEKRQRKAKFRRRQRKLEKLRAKGIAIDSLPPRPPPPPKPLETILSFAPSSSFKCLKVEGAKHTLEIRLVRSSPAGEDFNNTFQESCAVYKRYQEIIHNDPSTESGYRRFLVDSPLVPIPEEGQEEHHPGYGSFHQQYWLDGEKLIAVGVLDILSHSVSSKYLYYDPDYRPLALGVYSALQEIAFVRYLQKYSPDLRYYYMGFYIHTCPKMRYKGRYRPSELLCPESNTWHPIDACQKKLDVHTYCRFDETGAVDTDGIIDVNNIPVLFERTLMPYKVYKMVKYQHKPAAETDVAEVTEYARLLGKKASSSVILFRSAED